MYTVYKLSPTYAEPCVGLLFVCEYRQERERICSVLSRFGLAKGTVCPLPLECGVCVTDKQYSLLTIKETLDIMQNRKLCKTEVNLRKRYHM